ncbi:MAG: JAB domain-containing protein, partial [Phormidesmis sp.]
MQVGGNRCIVGHNHPSGSLQPSDEDIQLTEQLIKAGQLLGIPVLDHIVVSGNGYTSIRD